MARRTTTHLMRTECRNFKRLGAPFDSENPHLCSGNPIRTGDIFGDRWLALSSVFNSSGGFGKFGLSFISLTTPRPVVTSCGSVKRLNPATVRTRGLMIDLLA